MEKNNEVVKGKITRVMLDQGWGFIVSPDKKNIRFYFNWSNMSHTSVKDFNNLIPGMKVEFIPYEVTGKGWHAGKVKVLEDS